jgi:hypothetical protein
MWRRLTRTFTYWRELYRELRIFFIFRKTAYENQKMLEEKHKLRVDWLGRIYGVINIPEEVEGAAKQVQEAYVLEAITNYGKVMMEIGLADVQYPEIERIQGAAAYLVVLWPEYEALTFWRIIGNIIRTSIIFTLLYLLGKVIFKNWQYLYEWF